MYLLLAGRSGRSLQYLFQQQWTIYSNYIDFVLCAESCVHPLVHFVCFHLGRYWEVFNFVLVLWHWELQTYLILVLSVKCKSYFTWNCISLSKNCLPSDRWVASYTSFWRFSLRGTLYKSHTIITLPSLTPYLMALYICLSNSNRLASVSCKSPFFWKYLKCHSQSASYQCQLHEYSLFTGNLCEPCCGTPDLNCYYISKNHFEIQWHHLHKH